MKNIFLLAVLSAGFAQAQTNRLALTPKFINSLAEEARTNQPGMRAAQTRVRAASQNERAVRLWDDPEVMFGGFVGNGVMREEEGDLLYGVEQKLPINGKPQAERAVARAETRVEEADLDLRFQTLRRDIADAVLRAALADETVRISQLDQAWLETMVVNTTERYKAGRSTQTELLRMESEHATRAEQLRVAQRDRESELLIVNRLLNRPLETAWPELSLPALAPELAAPERILSLATKFEPKLRLFRHEIARSEATATVARRSGRPDFSIGADARQYAGDGQFKEGTVFLKMSVPWINKQKYDAAYHRDKARAEAVALEAAQYETEVREEILRLILRIGNARRQAVLYRDQIIPRSDQTLSVAESAWLNGRALFHEVLDARRILLDGRLMYVRAVADQYRALSQLVLCCGLGDLEAVELFEQNNPAPK